MDFRGESFGRRCGRWAASSLSLPHHTIVSPYNITIEFHSDESHTYSGFEAKWTTLSPRSKYLGSLLLDEPHNLIPGVKLCFFILTVQTSCLASVIQKMPTRFGQSTPYLISILFPSTAFPGCQEQINEIDGRTAGTLTSPDFPDHYIPFLDCHHMISVNPDQVKQHSIL